MQRSENFTDYIVRKALHNEVHMNFLRFVVAEKVLKLTFVSLQYSIMSTLDSKWWKFLLCVLVTWISTD